jgi:hypothetical protein
LPRGNLKFRRTPKPWKTVESRKIASLGDLKLHRDRIISKTGFEMVHPRLFVDDFSIVIPVLGRDKLVMVWNYRHAIQGWELERRQATLRMVKARRLVQGASWKRRPGFLQVRGGGLVGFTLLRDYPRREPTPILPVA